MGNAERNRWSNKMNLLSTYRVNRSWSWLDWTKVKYAFLQLRSMSVTAKLLREGEMCDPIPAPRCCTQIWLTALNTWVLKEAWTIVKISWTRTVLIFDDVFLHCPTNEVWTTGPFRAMLTETCVSPCWLTHSVVNCWIASSKRDWGTLLKNPTRSSLMAANWISSSVRKKTVDGYVSKFQELKVDRLLAAKASHTSYQEFWWWPAWVYHSDTKSMYVLCWTSSFVSDVQSREAVSRMC